MARSYLSAAQLDGFKRYKVLKTIVTAKLFIKSNCRFYSF